MGSNSMCSSLTNIEYSLRVLNVSQLEGAEKQTWNPFICYSFPETSMAEGVLKYYHLQGITQL